MLPAVGGENILLSRGSSPPETHHPGPDILSKYLEMLLKHGLLILHV